MNITTASKLIDAAKPGDLPTTAQIRRMTDDELSAYLDRVGWNDELAIEEFNDRCSDAPFSDEAEAGLFGVTIVEG